MRIPDIIKSVLTDTLKVGPFSPPDKAYSINSYSQTGEDVLLHSLLGKENLDGFFVDVGAHHPFRFSNTYLFYKKGWRGINIDPLPGAMSLFNQYRPDDINLEMGIAKQAGSLQYHMFEEPALNTFSPSELLLRKSQLIGTKEVPVYSLEEVLDTYLPKGKHIDMLTIDAEGMDEEVADSNNWEKYRPTSVVLEYHQSSLEQMMQNGIYLKFQSLGYSFAGRTRRSIVFLLSEYMGKVFGM